MFGVWGAPLWVPDSPATWEACNLLVPWLISWESQTDQPSPSFLLSSNAFAFSQSAHWCRLKSSCDTCLSPRTSANSCLHSRSSRSNSFTFSRYRVRLASASFSTLLLSTTTTEDTTELWGVDDSASSASIVSWVDYPQLRRSCQSESGDTCSVLGGLHYESRTPQHIERSVIYRPMTDLMGIPVRSAVSIILALEKCVSWAFSQSAH